jgi:hypothetical protein
MPKKKVISMLEFLRTGSFGGISCGMDVAHFVEKFGSPDWVWYSPELPNLGFMGIVESLEIGFLKDLNIIGMIKINFLSGKGHKRYSRFSKKIHPTHRVPYISRVKFNPWIIRDHLDCQTFQRFLMSAQLNYTHTKIYSLGLDQIEFESGVTLLFDSKDSDSPGLGHISISSSAWAKAHQS